MSHSLCAVWVHAIWHTKDNQPFITPEIEDQLYEHMYRLFIEIKCPAKIINGISDHVHCLFSLNRNLAVAQAIKKIKGNSTHWINETKLTSEYFSWQVGYSSFSVSESNLNIVKEYIKNQKKHHI
jgi:putative transposase